MLKKIALLATAAGAFVLSRKVLKKNTHTMPAIDDIGTALRELIDYAQELIDEQSEMLQDDSYAIHIIEDHVTETRDMFISFTETCLNRLDSLAKLVSEECRDMQRSIGETMYDFMDFTDDRLSLCTPDNANLKQRITDLEKLLVAETKLRKTAEKALRQWEIDLDGLTANAE